VLVLCPASAVPGWEREFNRFAECPPRLTVMSYDKAVRAGATLASREINPQFLSMHVDALILDEAHYLKNPKAKRTKLVYGPKCDGRGGLVEKAKRVYAVTGTPMPKDASELFPMMRALAPERIRNPKTGLPYNFWQFVTKYCVVKNNGFGLEIKGTKNHDELRKMLDGFMIRRTLADVSPEMPELIYDTLPVDAKFPKGVPSSEIEMARKALAEGGIEGLNAIGVHIATLRRLTGMAKVQPVCDWIKTHFECDGGKLVVFAWHTSVLDGLWDALKPSQSGITHLYRLDGSSTPAERDGAVSGFQGLVGKSVFLGNLQAAGTAIRLDAADQVLFVESSWVPSDNFQASQRILDATKTAGCLARFVCIPGSIDEDIMRVAARRAEDAQKILD
jgi:SWI/SNF-related matrix-associated actin-dependent regulator 1 of chromatin subfamily A